MKSANYTSNEDILRGVGWRNYVWGEVVAVHRIGDYAILEYVCNFGDNNGRNLFHPLYWTDKHAEYHDNNPYWFDTSTSYGTLEESLIGVIVHKFEGANSQAGHYFCKSIGLGKG